MVQIRIRPGWANFEESMLYKLVGVCLSSLIDLLPHQPSSLINRPPSSTLTIFHTRLLDNHLFSLAASNPLMPFANMGSGSSRCETRWWEAEAQRKVVTTKNAGKVEVICSLIPGVDEVAMVGYLKERSDLDTLFARRCRYQDLSREPRADPSNLPVDFKANELWRVLQMPLEYSGSPWDWNWRPPLEGIPSEIAADFHATVCQAIFRIPFSDFVKYALGYTTKARFLNNLLDGVCDIRDNLRTEYRNYVPVVAAAYSRSISKDRGYTWSRPGPCAAPGVTARVLPPDGAIAQSGQNTCGWGLGITYDRGLTFDYFLPATYFNGSAGVLDENTFWMADFDGQIVSVYRRK